MEKILFDTNILIHLVRGNDIAKKIKTLIDSLSDPQLFISVVSLGEVESLVVQWDWPTPKVVKLKELIRKFICIDIEHNNELQIQNYVSIDAFSQGKKAAPGGSLLKSSSRNMGKNDLWIAATAFALEATLYTMDNDFDHLHEVFFMIEKFKR